MEAWKTFLSARRPTVFSRYRDGIPQQSPVEIGRVVSLALAALFSVGADDPRKHIFLANNGALATIIVGRDQLSDSDMRALTEASEKLQYNIMMSPQRPIELPVFKDLAAAKGADDLDARAQRYPLDVSAPTDARPFFFNQVRISHPQDVMEMIAEYRRSGDFHNGASVVPAGNLLAIGTLVMLVMLSAVLVFVVVVIPGRQSMRIANPKLVWWDRYIFCLSGSGSCWSRSASFKEMSIFIGHPVYGLSIVLFSIILSTGIGSFVSKCLGLRTRMHVIAGLGLSVYTCLSYRTGCLQ